MLFATMGQGARFVFMLAAGVVMGGWVLLVALLRRVLCAGFWLNLACDLLLGVGAAVVFLAALICASYGRLRAFDLLATLCGMALFGFGLADPARAAARRIARRGRKIATAVSKNRRIKAIFK